MYGSTSESGRTERVTVRGSVQTGSNGRRIDNYPTSKISSRSAGRSGSMAASPNDNQSLLRRRTEPRAQSPNETASLVANSDRDGDGGRKTGNITLGKELSLISSTAVVVGLMIGSGIFITPSSILCYTQSFGLSMILWTAGGLVALCGGLCYAELGVLVKKSGSTYAFILEGYSFRRRNKCLTMIGSLLAFLNVWSNTLIGQPTGIAVVSLTFGRYVCRPFFIGCSEVPTIPVKMLAFFALLLMALVNIYSVKLAARLMTALSSLKLIAMAAIVLLAVYYFIDKGALSEDVKHPFANHTTSASSIALAFYGVMWAYDGWDALYQVLEETKNTEKTVVRVAFIGVPIVVLCYLIVNLSYFTVLSYEQLESAEAVGLVYGEAVIGKAGLVIMSLLIALATFGAIHSNLFTAARQMFAASRDGLLPEMFSGVHITFRTPMPAVLLITFVSMVMVAVGNIDQLIDAFTASVWVFHGLAIGALLIMRLTHQDVPRKFEVLLLLPCFMLLVAIFLIVVPLWRSPIPQLMAFGGILLGVPFYIVFVMAEPVRLKPRLFNTLSSCLTRLTNVTLNCQTSKFIPS